VKDELINRRVKSITVVPITWRTVAIGAIFLRTYRDGPTFSDGDVRFVQVVAALTAQSLRNAHRYERLAQRTHEFGDQLRHMELERVALLAFFRRLLDAFGAARARGAKVSCPKPAPTSWTAWSAWPWPSSRKKPKGGEAGSTRR